MTWTVYQVGENNKEMIQYITAYLPPRTQVGHRISSTALQWCATSCHAMPRHHDHDLRKWYDTTKHNTTRHEGWNWNWNWIVSWNVKWNGYWKCELVLVLKLDWIWFDWEWRIGYDGGKYCYLVYFYLMMWNVCVLLMAIRRKQNKSIYVIFASPFIP